MTGQEFNHEVNTLTEQIEGMIAAYFKAKGSAYNPQMTRLYSDTDLNQYVKDAFFFGAEVFPDT